MSTQASEPATLNKSINFYKKFLGLRVLSKREIPHEQRGNRVSSLDPDGKGATLELTFYKNQKKFIQPEYENRLFDHLAFEVESMEKTIAAMHKEGVTVTDEPFRLAPNGMLIAFVEDPDGTLIELIEKK